MTQKKGSVTQAAEALFLTPQTVTGQIKLLEQRLGGKLLMRKGRSLEATELGQLVFRYADKMFSLSYEMLDIVNYRRARSCSTSASPMRSPNVLPAGYCSPSSPTTVPSTCVASNRPMSCCWNS